MALLQVADYPSVRAALDVRLAEGHFPSDQVIGLPIYAGQAEEAVLPRYPGAATAPPAAAPAVQRAVVYYTAALLCPAMPNLTAEDEAGYRYSAQARDWEARADELERLG